MISLGFMLMLLTTMFLSLELADAALMDGSAGNEASAGDMRRIAQPISMTNKTVNSSAYVIMLPIIVTGRAEATASGNAIAATITVMNSNDSGVGSLRQAIADASAGDIIQFDNSLSTIVLTSGQLLIDKDLTIEGPNIKIDGNSNDRVFDIAANAIVEISQITIQNGRVNESGGGIRNEGTLTLTNSIVMSHTAKYGGGIFNKNIMRLNKTIVSGNTTTTPDFNSSSSGGGIRNGEDGILELIDSTVSNNYAIATNIASSTSGGGIKNEGILTLNNSRVTTNTVTTNNIGSSAGGGALVTKIRSR
jgi:hypothetical protein